MPGEDLHLSMLVRSQAHLNRCAVGADATFTSVLPRGPAKVSGRFDLYFGAAIALAGITCSGLTYWSATAADGGIWTLYYGMIAWGLI